MSVTDLVISRSTDTLALICLKLYLLVVIFCKFNDQISVAAMRQFCFRKECVCVCVCEAYSFIVDNIFTQLGEYWRGLNETLVSKINTDLTFDSTLRIEEQVNSTCKCC